MLVLSLLPDLQRIMLELCSGPRNKAPPAQVPDVAEGLLALDVDGFVSGSLKSSGTLEHVGC